MTNAADFYKLQQIDTELLAKRTRLQQSQKESDNQEELRLFRLRVQQLEMGLEMQPGPRSVLQLESDSLEERIGEMEALLTRGGVTNPAELASLKANIDSLRRQQSESEQQAVEIASAIEYLEAPLAEARGALADIELKRQPIQDALVEESDNIRRTLADLAVQRENAAQALGALYLARYEERRKKYRGGVAVVAIDSEGEGGWRPVCGGCHSILEGFVVKIVRSQELPERPTCGRLLYSST